MSYRAHSTVTTVVTSRGGWDVDDYAKMLDARGVVKPEFVDDLMVEVVSGRYLFDVRGRCYASRVATAQEQDMARLVFRRRFNECRAMGLPTREELAATARENGIITVVEEAEIRSIEKHMARLKSAMEKATEGTMQYRAMQAEMTKLQNRHGELQLIQAGVFMHCVEVRAEEAKASYLTFATTMAGDFLDQPAWPAWDDYQQCTDYELLLKARTAQLRVSAGLPVNVIRGLARTPQWRQRYKAAKESRGHLFEGAIADWDINKINLVTWSDFYDSVLTHPECPSENIIHDDKMLQQWINEQVQKSRGNRQAGGGKGNAVTYVSGGKRKVMQQISRTTTHVGQGYRMPGQ